MKLFLILLLSTAPMYAFSPPSLKVENYCKMIDVVKKEIAKKEYVATIVKTVSIIETRGNHKLIGGSGEQGEYQIMPATWKAWSKMYFGKFITPTLENQYKMIVCVISDWVEKGFTVKQIAAKWNCGDHLGWENKIGVNKYNIPYNVPNYVKTFVYQFNKLSNHAKTKS